METFTTVVLVGIVSAFTIFGGVLAYVERLTRNLQQEMRPTSPTPVTPEERKAA